MSDPSHLVPSSPPPQATPQQTIAQIERAHFNEGFKHSLPTLVGAAAWGSVVGVAMVNAGMTWVQALCMTVVLAGSAQLAALPLLVASAPMWVIFFTALVVNLRFVIFSALLAPYFAGWRTRVKVWLGYMSGDIPNAMFLQRFPNVPTEPGSLGYFKGLVTANTFAWQFGSLSGIFLGSQIPPSWGLAFAGTLALVCVGLPLIANRAALVGVIVSGAVAVWAHALPYRLGLLVAVIAGVLAAIAMQELNLRLKAAEVNHD
jgi:predicted branched-subunit amino acid permease